MFVGSCASAVSHILFSLRQNRRVFLADVSLYSVWIHNDGSHPEPALVNKIHTINNDCIFFKWQRFDQMFLFYKILREVKSSMILSARNFLKKIESILFLWVLTVLAAHKHIKFTFPYPFSAHDLELLDLLIQNRLNAQIKGISLYLEKDISSYIKLIMISLLFLEWQF